jgi:predicted RNase H-like HicB family nuclease
MFEEYLNAGMHLAKYELLEENGGFYVWIPEAPGVYANAGTLEACRDLLREVLEGWVVLGIAHHHVLPEFNGVRFLVPAAKVAVQAA